MNHTTPSMPCEASRSELRRQHLAWLHPKGSVGRPWIGLKSDGTFKGEPVEVEDAWRSGLWTDAQYASVNRFWGFGRDEAHVKSVGSFVLDFDYHFAGLPHAHLPAEEVGMLLMAAFEQAGIPMPALVGSGRGVQAQWCCHNAKPSTLARVRAVYDALHGTTRRRREDPEYDAWTARMRPLWILFGQLGIDPNCRDAARVVRLAGSINAKSGTMARLLFPATFAEASTYSFHDLADAILPVKRADLVERRVAREAQGIPRGAAKARRLPTSFWPGVLADLMNLRAHRGGIAPGMRDTWLFLTANAIAHVRGGDRDIWAAELAPLAGLSEREARSTLSTLDRRQRRAEAGDMDAYDGRERSPLYGYSAARMIVLLGITQEEATAAGLRKLVPAGSKVMSPAERKRAERDRRNPDRITKPICDAVRDIRGRMIIGMRADGHTIEAIAAILKVSCETIRTALNTACAAQGLPDASVASCRAYDDATRPGTPIEASIETVVVEPAAATEASSGSKTPKAVSRSIVGSACATPASKPAVVPVLPGEIRVKRWTCQFVVVETATGTWEWMHYLDKTWFPFTWETTWRRITPSAPLWSDQMLAEAAKLELDASTTTVKAAARRACHPIRVASKRRPSGSQRLRRVGYRSLPPLDVKRAGEAYRLASQGG